MGVYRFSEDEGAVGFRLFSSDSTGEIEIEIEMEMEMEV